MSAKSNGEKKGWLARLKSRFSTPAFIGNASGEEDTESIVAVVLRINGVVAVQSCSAKEQGHYVVAEVTINVNPKIMVQEGHEIALRVRWLLMHRFTHLSDVIVHVKPFNPDYPYKSNIDGEDEQISSILQ